jgi:hypothetical protein
MIFPMTKVAVTVRFSSKWRTGEKAYLKKSRRPWRQEPRWEWEHEEWVSGSGNWEGLWKSRLVPKGLWSSLNCRLPATPQ